MADIQAAVAPPVSLLSRLGLDRPVLRAWAMYDWANSAFWATVIQIFPVYFISVVASDLPKNVANARYAWATTSAMVVVAVISPVLGAIADYAGAKKKMMAAFIGLGVPATAAMFFVYRGQWVFGVTVYILGNIGVAGSIVFYESLLPHIAREDEIDRVSSAGYAMGYLGSGMLMAVNLLWIQKPEWFGMRDSETATRISLLSAALWWLVFSIPLFRSVPEPPRALESSERVGLNAVTAAFGRLGETFRELRRYREALLLLIAFLIYNDGIGTIIRMAAPYGTEIGIPPGALIGAILLVQFVGIPFAFLFGMIAGKIGAKRSIFIALVTFLGVTVIGYYMTTAFHFFILAFLVGMVQGGAQALSRSLFATMIPRHKSAEFFAFYGAFDKFAGILGPMVFAVVIESTGSSRNAILTLIVFFVVGGTLLAFVDVEKGQKLARLAEAEHGVVVR
jgi:MFS transporter, UMF1 family